MAICHIRSGRNFNKQKLGKFVLGTCSADNTKDNSNQRRKSKQDNLRDSVAVLSWPYVRYYCHAVY